MTPVEDKDKNVFLYIACYANEKQKSEGFIAVTKAMLYDEVAIEMENIGDHAIVFTTTKKLSEIKEKLKSSKTPYLLIDIGISYDLESISGIIPDTDIEIFKKISKGEFSKDKNFLKRKLSDSLEEENFELAAALRDSNK